MLIAVMDPAERLGPGSRALNLWADLYRRGAFRASLPSGSWQAADDLLRVARAADRSARDGLAKSLAISNRIFDPLADPLAVEFHSHRWLSSEREEAYSDWLGWILDQTKDAGRVLKLLGVRDGKLLRECASEKPTIRREAKIPTGRTDLFVEFGNRLLIIVEVKTKAFDGAGVQEQLEKYDRWIKTRPQPTRCYFAAEELVEFDCPASFELLPWRELTLRMREQAWEWIGSSKKRPRDGSDLIRAAMTLAFCGAVEQNLLELSGEAAMFRIRLSAEYLEEWVRKREG